MIFFGVKSRENNRIDHKPMEFVGFGDKYNLNKRMWKEGLGMGGK